ncbi:hypothetical protein Q7L73_28595, partial [Conexibacter sp. CPCC 205762]
PATPAAAPAPPAAPPAPADPRLARGRAVAELLLGRVGGDVERTARAGALLAAGARADASAIADDLRVAALAQLGAVEVWCGRLDPGERRLEAALAAARERELAPVALLAQAQLALAALLAGRLVLAAERARAALTAAERRGLERTAAAATAQTVLTATLLHWEQREEAERLLARAERTLRPLGERSPRALAAQQRIALLIADGAWDMAVALLRAAQAELAGWPLAPQLRARFVAQEGLLRAARGEREAAASLLRAACMREPRPEHAAALARLRLASGEPAQASAAIAPWLAQAERGAPA